MDHGGGGAALLVLGAALYVVMWGKGYILKMFVEGILTACCVNIARRSIADSLIQLTTSII